MERRVVEGWKITKRHNETHDEEEITFSRKRPF